MFFQNLDAALKLGCPKLIHECERNEKEMRMFENSRFTYLQMIEDRGINSSTIDSRGTSPLVEIP
jgi:hypothetical protein